jgi:hypothetical protein
VGIRPGEKIHEVLVSEEEIAHSVFRGENLVIQPVLPELRVSVPGSLPLPFEGEYSSAGSPIGYQDVRDLLLEHQLTADTVLAATAEILR